MQEQLGLTADEVCGAAKAMVSHAVPLNVSGETTDIVGTGGDGFATVNLSTMGSVAAAAAGVKIVKHGNRAASSKCGAADVLEDLGLPMDLKPEAVGEIGDEVGITFAFARTFHPAMRFVGWIRAALGIPCVFNILGSLTNPANPAHVAIGCANRKLSPIMAAVYASRGQSGLVYTSHEASTSLLPPLPDLRVGDSRRQGHRNRFRPDRGSVSCQDLRRAAQGRRTRCERRRVHGLLGRQGHPSRTTALLNAASAIVADGNLVGGGTLAERFREAYALAENTVDSGKAAAMFGKWIETAKSKA